MAKVCLSGSLLCATQAESEIVRQHLAAHIDLTRSEPGCLYFEVTETEDPLVWRVEELFIDQAAFDAHQIRTKASQWAEKTAAIRRRYQITTE
jgi:quinol monooxygenase YgiN